MKRMVLMAIAAALVLAPAVGEAASAKRGKACPDGAVCLWPKVNFGGDRQVFKNEGATNVSKKLNNRVSSVKDRSEDAVYLMDAKNGRADDDYQCMFENQYRDLGKIGFDNVISSVLRIDPDDPLLPC